MTRKLWVVFLFYKMFLLPSFLINCVLFFTGFHLLVSFIAKFILSIVLAFSIQQSQLKEKLLFYNNLAVSNQQLFLYSLGFDFMLLMLIYLIFSALF